MATKLLLIRHAKPEDHLTDTLRQLSKDGRLIQKKMSAFLLSKGFHPSCILHSPLLRAEETAEILGETFHIQPEVETALSYDFDEQALLKKIPDPKLNETIIFVGHMPSLLLFAHALVGKPFLPGEIARSGTVVLEFEQEIGFGKAHFITYYPPESFL